MMKLALSILIVILGGFLWFFFPSIQGQVYQYTQSILNREGSQKASSVECARFQDDAVRAACERTHGPKGSIQESGDVQEMPRSLILCAPFQDVSIVFGLPCEEAVLRVLAEIPGTVTDISLDFAGNVSELTRQNIPQDARIWLIEVRPSASDTEVVRVVVAAHDPQTIYRLQSL